MAWESLISNVGFPIAITIYILVRMEKTINNLKETINKNTLVIAELRQELARRR